MAVGYSGRMRAEQPLPAVWLLSDERNDARLEEALRRLPRRSGFIFRHYHLAPEERFDRFQALRRVAKARGHLVILADSALTAREWRADGCYGAPRSLAPKRAGLLALATAHDMAEIALAHRMGADAALLSPVFATRSHPGAATMGPLRFRFLAARATMPVIALGGMTAANARRLDWARWAAIDGLSTGLPGRFS
jgi:thiamine-phosphate pyrophosphorylase